MSKYRKKLPLVVFFHGSRNGSDRETLHGIQRYAKLYGPWGMQILSGNIHELRSLCSSSSRRADSVSGALAYVATKADFKLLSGVNTPIVLFDPSPAIRELNERSMNFPFVTQDNRQTGILAAEYFLGKKMSHFAFVHGAGEAYWSEERFQGFSDRLTSDGHFVHFLSHHSSVKEKSTFRKQLSNWLQKLPKPAAVFAASDIEGQEVLDVCRMAKIAVPYEITVLGVGNDEMLCESTFPSLSSIAVHWQRCGFAAAEMLDQLMRRSVLKHRSDVYAPVDVYERDSTNTLLHPTSQSPAVNNDCMIRALEFIRINSGFAIQVADVAKQVGVSRQWLEKRFKADLGHSILDEIRKHRMKRICTLLTETALPIVKIAEMSGFENANHLRLVFKEEFGMTMSEYRDNNDKEL